MSINIRKHNTPDDLKNFNYERDLGNPGEYPFTRGVYPTMYTERLWTMRQYAGFGDAAQTNERFRYLLEKGQTGLSVAFDLPTQLGLDSDHHMSYGEVGRCGVAVSTMDDMRTIFKEINLGKVSTSMTINATAPVLLGMYVLLAEEQGIHMDKLRGTVQNDLLKEFLARGNYIFPVAPSVKITTDVIEYCIKHIPKWYYMSVSGYHIREAGATAAQEVALTFANGIDYVESAIGRGLDVDDFAPRISFFFGCHSNFMEEVAKFRAARRIWARVMKERFKAKDPKSLLMKFHTQTCGSTLTAQDVQNNIIRVGLQAFAAVLGGTQSLHTNSYDEALSLPSENAVKMALRTQQLIAFESGVTGWPDPLAGSYTLEKLTNDLEEEVMAILETIDKKGGGAKCVESGFSAKLIEDSAYKYQKDIENCARKVVGVNMMQAEEEEIPEFSPSPVDHETRVKELAQYKTNRDNNKLNQKLDMLREAADKKDNIMPFVIDSLRVKATLGEITDVLKEIYGTYD
ncbi:methylmalonyl-CoA mutase [bacterium]|nr:methylmalonyl-CoA mutase [bacterium]